MTSTTTNQQTAAQPIDLDSLPLYFNREYYRVEDVRAALARQQPAARVDRIISASGLAEVSVFLESALKVGTVFYAAAAHAAAAPSAEQATPLGDLWIHEDMDRDAAASAMNAPRKDLKAAHKQAVDDVIYWRRLALTAEASTGAAAKTEQPPSGNTGEVAASVKTWQERSDEAMHTETWYPPGHYKDLEIADLRAQLARQRQAVPHAQAAPVHQMRSLTEPGGWLDTDADGPTSIKRMPHWASVYEFRTLSAAPVPQEAEQAGDIELIRIPAHDADSYCRILSIIGMEEEGDPVAEVQRLFDAAQEAEQAAPAAVTDDLREAVRSITLLIQNREWADVLDMDADAIALWDAVNEMVEEANAAFPAPAVTDAARDVAADAKDADRYRWLRNPDVDVGLVLDKRTGFVPPDENFPGIGGYSTYEYRAGDDLDEAIDAVMLSTQSKE